MIVKKVDPFSVARVFAAVYGTIAMLVAALALIRWLLQLGEVVSLTWIVVAPLMTAGIAFILSFVSASFYNIIARAIGGVEIEIEQG